jgi:hypothetical protein
MENSIKENVMTQSKLIRRALLTSTFLVGGIAQMASAQSDQITFNMVESAGAKACVPNAFAEVVVKSNGARDAEDMTIMATGLPPNTDFDVFVIQVPLSPFGVSWYQGDIQSNSAGNAIQHFRGRFNIETFSVAPGKAPAPQVFNDQPFPDAKENPPFNPIQMYHLGIWFNSPDDAGRLGCARTVTPFNGEHNAGIQILNTSNFPDLQGPLIQLRP